MNTTTSSIASYRSTNYRVVAPLSIFFALIAAILSCLIGILISLTRQLHTAYYLLVSNTCLASILFCVAQCNNYIYLLLITWDKSDQSCRWRGYFGYMSASAVTYSYLLQAMSRLFFIVLSTKYRWLISFKTHLWLISIGWAIVFLVPLPSLLTKDIYFREGILCWVPKTAMSHVAYGVVTYYLIPISLIIIIYLYIYMKIRHSANNVRRRNRRDMEIFRRIMILFCVYIGGAIPTLLYVLTGIEIFYSMGIVSVTLLVAVEKFVTLLLDREIRNSTKKMCWRRSTRVVPLSAGTFTVQR